LTGKKEEDSGRRAGLKRVMWLGVLRERRGWSEEFEHAWH